MLDEKDLQAIAKLMDANFEKALDPINKRLDSMDERLSRIEERVTKIEVVQENITNKNIQLLFEGQQGITEKFQKLDRMEMTLNNVKSDSEVIKDVVTEHSKSIRELKKAQ